MLDAIEIQNFKSAQKLKLDFGQINVFIGENGSGKSTILEALTFVGAAEANKLDNEFLASRGIRVTSPKLMRSNFDKVFIEKPISITVSLNKTIDDDGETTQQDRVYTINNDNDTYSKWKLEKETFLKSSELKVSRKEIQATKLEMDKLFDAIGELKNNLEISEDKRYKFAQLLDDDFFKNIENMNKLDKEMLNYDLSISSDLSTMQNFVIYTPQNKQLRTLKEEGQIQPLGIHGEGLFKLIREIHKTQPEAMVDVQRGLELIGWYESMELTDESDKSDDELLIQDRFLPSTFSQNSTNEGFLYILFYMALIVSKDTPEIFAIDNIDAALNPKLCSKIMSYLSELAKKYDKQLFLTTQNPAILDGINLNDKEQKLFVVSRNKKGHTKVKNIPVEKKPKDSDGNPLRLSEAMLRGYIGGLPKGF